MRKKLSPYGVDIIKTCMTFGVSLGLQLYIIGVLFGGWLDRRLGTAPLFLMLGLLTAIFIAFYRLIIDFKRATEAEEERSRREKPHYIDYDALFAEDKPAEDDEEDKREE